MGIPIFELFLFDTALLVDCAYLGLHLCTVDFGVHYSTVMVETLAETWTTGGGERL